MSWKSESESFLTWTYKYTWSSKRYSVYQLGEFSSVKNQASQELDCLLVIKGFAFQAVRKKKKKKKDSNQNLGDSFFPRKLSGLGMAWGREQG